MLVDFCRHAVQVRLAHDARLEAVRALELEPCNDLSHHLMGRWHYEMASLNMVVRTVIRVMYGTALAPGTFQVTQRMSCGDHSMLSVSRVRCFRNLKGGELSGSADCNLTHVKDHNSAPGPYQ